MSASDLLPAVEIVIDGKPHVAKCTLGTLLRYELATGLDILNNKDAQTFSAVNAIKFILAALDIPITPDNVREYGDKLAGEHLGKVSEIIAGIFAAGLLGKPEAATGEETPSA